MARKDRWGRISDAVEDVLGKDVKITVRDTIYDGGRIVALDTARWALREYRKGQRRLLRQGHDPGPHLTIRDMFYYVAFMVDMYESAMRDDLEELT